MQLVKLTVFVVHLFVSNISIEERHYRLAKTWSVSAMHKIHQQFRAMLIGNDIELHHKARVLSIALLMRPAYPSYLNRK